MSASKLCFGGWGATGPSAGASASRIDPAGNGLRLDSLRRPDRDVEKRHPELQVLGADVADTVNVCHGLDSNLSAE